MSRYTVCVIRDFVAQHFLIGGDWGKENDWHSHHYKVEASFFGDELDQHGYLLDISVVERELGRLIARYSDKTLNELPELEGRNPSLERFARLLCDGLVVGMAGDLTDGRLHRVVLKLWEHEQAYATYTHELAAR